MKIQYIKNIDEFKNIKLSSSSVSYLKILWGNDTLHPACSSPVVSIFNINWETTYVVNHLHDQYYKTSFNEFIKQYLIINSSVKNKFIENIKKSIHFCSDIKDKKFNDLETYYFNKLGVEPSEEYKIDRNLFYKERNSIGLNVLIPLVKHVEEFNKCIEDYKFFTEYQNLNESGYRSLIDDILPFLYKIEKSGVYCDKELLCKYFGYEKSKFLTDGGMFYNEYNIYSSTGRPSNSIHGINFSALNKENGERKMIKSRYGKDGKLILFDFKAYHPRLLASLVNYKLPAVKDLYIWLTSEMKKYSETKEQNLKGEVFTQLYGKIDEKYLEIEYFNKINKFIKNRWEYFNEHGYVDTPLFKRSINQNHLTSPVFPNKVVNYILQAYETERNCRIMEPIFMFLDKKLTLPVLYNYDSILYDFHISDGKETLVEIKKLMEDGGYPVSIKAGNDFHEMKKIDL